MPVELALASRYFSVSDRATKGRLAVSADQDPYIPVTQHISTPKSQVMDHQVDVVKDNYVLPRDDAEFARLNAQHVFLKMMVCDGRLIYDETVTLPTGSSVLDSGTGSGAWAIDLANEVPQNVEIYGSDISGHNFPKSAPSNVHFHEVSSTNFPEEWAGKFEVINQRMLFGGLSKTQWPVVLSEFMRILKPSGYVQFIELDISHPILAGPACRRFIDLGIQMMNQNGMMFDAAQQLPKMAKTAGFVDIVSEKKYGPIGKSFGEMGELGVLSNRGVLKGVGPVLVRTGLVAEDELGQLHEDMLKEYETIEGTRFVYHMVHARKPE